MRQKMVLLNRTFIYKIQWRYSRKSGSPQINQFSKRASMLENMLQNRDTNKNWHFHILQNNVKAKNVFERIYRPNKRQTVLNSLFIRNITDVISTSDVAPEVYGKEIEITGVKISPCCKNLNVYWQIPESKFDKEEEISTLLNLNASKIRAELISRNLMGRVPLITFVRDVTNSRVAAFEKAMKEIDCGTHKEALVPEEIFTSKKKKIFCFRESTLAKLTESRKEPTPTEDTPTNTDLPPEKPQDMRRDIFRLNQDIMMKRVMESKLKSPEKSIEFTSVLENDDDDYYEEDLFSKIPGTTIHAEKSANSREQVLRQFHIQRKILMNEKNRRERTSDELVLQERNTVNENELNFSDFMPEEEEGDFVEEETADKFH